MSDEESPQFFATIPHMEDLESLERGKSQRGKKQTQSITLQQAIDFGEYDPKYLANFAEWHTLSPHIQWQLIRKALDIRQKQLITQYAELNNSLDLRLKPHIHDAMKNVEKQLSDLAKDRENLYVDFSGKA